MNTAKQPSKKPSRATKNTVGVQIVKGFIRLSLPRSISRTFYNTDQKFISPGLEATPLNLKRMEGVAAHITTDIATVNFDPTWEKYKIGITANFNNLIPIDGGKKPDLTLKQLWETYLKNKPLAETTRGKAYSTYTRTIMETKDNMTPLEVEQLILAKHTPLIAKGLLGALRNCYEWGKEEKYVSENPYFNKGKKIKGNVKKRKIKSLEDTDYIQPSSKYKGFTKDERDVIIAKFENTSSIRHYASFVKFLFWTGCRPGEAIALRWKHISNDFKRIRFEESYYSELKIEKDTKTSEARDFRTGVRLQELLQSIKAVDAKPDDLVFTSKQGNHVNYNRFKLTWLGNPKSRYPGVIPGLIKEGKIPIYLKPYATRHTYITLMLNEGVNIIDIARNVGNSPEVILEHYASATRDLILPEV